MSSNSFGKIFKITTFGESHGKAVGVVIDGCPAGLEISLEEINAALAKRAPGQNPYTSPRGEKDVGDILSGIFEGKTTGAPICIVVYNKDADSSKYAPIKDLLRPGHANFTYLEKYGIFDWRGGGRSSARETIGRVAAGAVAKKLIEHYGIKVVSYLKQVGDIKASIRLDHGDSVIEKTNKSPLFCPDEDAEKKMIALIEQAKLEGDSLGGVIEFVGWSLPTGLGDPVYDKLEASLAKAMLTLPATKAFEMGMGFDSVTLSGSSHNDLFIKEGEKIVTATNHAGGTLGGISTGMPLVGRIAFKPTSSIKKPQASTDIKGRSADFVLPEGSRHDPCVAIRAAPIVEAMLSLVIADALLMNRCAKL